MRFIGAGMLLSLAGCGPTPTPNVEVVHGDPGNATETVADKPRFVVNIVGTFRDDLAYDSARGIYLIKDTKTGREYFGVSGVGIAETGAHAVGKSSIQDER